MIAFCFRQLADVCRRHHISSAWEMRRSFAYGILGIAHSIGQAGMRLARSLSADQRGSILPATTTGIIASLGFMGLAIDSGRMVFGKDVLQKSLDSAALAAGHAQLQDDMIGDARAFFDANIRSAGDVLVNPDLTITISEDNRTVMLEATASVSATFTSLFGFETYSLRADATVERETRGMELMLVMDNTGSMRSGGKMNAMKDAARDMINIVYGDNDTNPNLYVGLVPYTTVVNVGGEYENFLSSEALATLSVDFHPETWKGCVMARENMRDRDDSTPMEYPFTPYLYKDDVDNDWIDYPDVDEEDLDELVTVEEDNGDIITLFGNDGPEVEVVYNVDARNSAQNNGRGPSLGCGPALTPLIESKEQVLAAVDEMLPWHRGGTASSMGMVWGWRAISPRWRGLWNTSRPDVTPLDYEAPFMDKVVVVLTDGQNQFYDWKSHGPNNGNGPNGSDFTAYGRLNDFGFNSLGSARAEIDVRFADICFRMKQEGIIIYSITFGSTPNSATQSLYRTCASDPAFYYHAPNNGTLSEAFEAIGRQLSNLRLAE